MILTTKSKQLSYLFGIGYFSHCMSRLALATLRAAPNATPGPSRIPAECLHGRWYSSFRLINERSSSSRYQHVRFNSSSSGTKSSLTPLNVSHKSAAFEELNTSLSASQPCFGTRGDEISLLTSPEEFYGRLLDMISRAKRRIIISSLYIGAEESELVSGL